MDFSSVFRTHDFLEDAAVSYGFKKKGGVFTLERMKRASSSPASLLAAWAAKQPAKDSA